MNPPDNDSKGNGTFVYIQSPRTPKPAPTQLTVNNSLVNSKYLGYGSGNVAAETNDPKLLQEDSNVLPDPTNPRYSTGFDGFDSQLSLLLSEGLLDLHLQPGSPCIGTGFNGEDMGFYVPEGASITGVPASPTTQTDVTSPSPAWISTATSSA